MGLATRALGRTGMEITTPQPLPRKRRAVSFEETEE
jgi:hypothetical protein